jgi:hypothetical protein
MIQTDALPMRPSVRAERSVPSSLAVLIEVPDVKASGPLRGRRRVADPQHVRRRFSRPSRRRLRREVRVAGCTLLAFLPLVCVCTLGWLSRSNQVLAASISNETAGSHVQLAVHDRIDRAELASATVADPFGLPSAFVLTIEPAVVAPGLDREVPVVLPGYVLPDDSLEESSHEGS